MGAIVSEAHPQPVRPDVPDWNDKSKQGPTSLDVPVVSENKPYACQK